MVKEENTSIERLKRNIENKTSLDNRKVLFKPLIDGYRKNSTLSFYYDFVLNLRRMSTIYLAMFLPDNRLTCLTVFHAGSLLTALLLVHVKPFKNLKENRIQVFDEIVVMITSTFVYIIPGYGNDRVTLIGEFIGAVIWGSLAVNALIIIKQLLHDMKLKFQKCRTQIKIKRMRSSKNQS